MNNSFYFQHDYNARNDQKILELRAEYGSEGYGIWWMLLETIAEQDEGVKRGALGGLKLAFGVDKDTLEGVINLCLELGLLYESDGYLRNSRMDEHKALRDKFKEAGRKGGKKSKKGSRSEDSSDGGKKGGLKPPPKQGKERKGKESIGNEEEKVEKENGVDSNAKTEDQLKLEKWFKENYPEVAKLKYPTPEQMKRLKANYGQKAIEEILLDMDNYKPLTSKYKEIYKTLLNWLKKRYGEMTKDENGNELKPKSKAKPQVKDLR